MINTVMLTVPLPTKEHGGIESAMSQISTVCTSMHAVHLVLESTGRLGKGTEEV